MKKERDFIVEKLQEAGVHGKIHDSLKSLKNCNEVHVGAVLRSGERVSRSKSKKIYDGNWVEMEIGEVDWVQGEDTILKSKMAVEFDMTLTGGVYVDVPMKEISANYDYTVKKVGD